MERQLANLTGLVQKALTQTPTPREYLQVPPPASARDANYRNGKHWPHLNDKNLVNVCVPSRGCLDCASQTQGGKSFEAMNCITE